MQSGPHRLRLLVVCLALAGCGLWGTAGRDDALASLTVVNRSYFTVCAIELARSHGPARERERFVDPVPPGASRTLRLRAGRWDVRLEDCRGGPLMSRDGLLVRGRRRLEFDPPAVERLPMHRRRRMASRPRPAG